MQFGPETRLQVRRRHAKYRLAFAEQPHRNSRTLHSAQELSRAGYRPSRDAEPSTLGWGKCPTSGLADLW